MELIATFIINEKKIRNNEWRAPGQQSEVQILIICIAVMLSLGGCLLSTSIVSVGARFFFFNFHNFRVHRLMLKRP